MGPAIWLSLLAILFIYYLYIRVNDAKLKRLSPEAAAFSPKRWSEDEIRSTAAKFAEGPTSLLEGKLPPKTGRRYIVVGGAGFLGGWIVLHLLQRGEDPRRIRVLDIRTPVRKDLKQGAAKDVEFLQVDISDRKAVDAAFAKPWPKAAADVAKGPDPEITVFHTAATIRFFERHPSLLYLSERVNLKGTQYLVDAARRTGARTFVSTSSGSVSVRRSRFWLWPWEREPKYFVQPITDDDNIVPKRHDQFFSNYAVSKWNGERYVRAADKTPSGAGVLRTGCIRPGNGVFGPGGDLLAENYLAMKVNYTWIHNVLQSFTYVENCSLAHLCYEQRLIELENGVPNPDIGGQAFCVADSGPPPTYGDMFNALNILSDGETTFPALSPTFMLGIATLIEVYYLTRTFLLSSCSFLGRLVPPVVGDIVYLQPSVFALTNVHLIFDDSRARAPPEKGGLGYTQTCTTLEGTCKVVAVHQKEGASPARTIAGHAEADHGFGFSRIEKGAEDVVGKFGEGLGVDATKILVELN